MDTRIHKILDKEISRQATTIELIASENFASDAVMELAGSIFTCSKYPHASTSFFFFKILFNLFYIFI